MRLLGYPIFNNTEFDWTYSSGKNRKKVIKYLTPLTFYNNYCNINFDDFVRIVNDPRPRHPYNKMYTHTDKYVLHLDINESDPLSKCLNLHIDDIKQLIIKQIDSNIPVWYTCDVCKYNDDLRNIMDINIYNYDLAFDTSFTKMSKADNIDFCNSYGSHAMIIIGYDINETVEKNKRKKITENSSNKKNKGCEKNNRDYDNLVKNLVKFKVENSWGDYGKQHGFITMTNKWFEMFSYEFIVHKKILE